MSRIGASRFAQYAYPPNELGYCVPPGARAMLDADGVPPEQQTFLRYADCRYPSQGYELRVAADDGEVDEGWVARLATGFHDLHDATYRSRFDERPVHLVNLRVVGVGSVAAPATERAGDADEHVPDPVDEIASFFREVMEEDSQRAQKAHDFLAKLGGTDNTSPQS